MVEAYMINVGFHSNFGAFRQSENSKSPLIFKIVEEFPFNPTYDPLKIYHELSGNSVSIGVIEQEFDFLNLRRLQELHALAIRMSRGSLAPVDKLRGVPVVVLLDCLGVANELRRWTRLSLEQI